MITCALCPRVNACIPPDGDGDILFVGEAPGPNEDRNAKKHPPGKVFIGKAGEELDRHYLPLAGLRRSGVRIVNAIRCFPISAGGKLDPNRTKDLDLLESCASQFLYPDVEQGRYKAIVPMGAFACKAVYGQGFDLELRHGIPTETPWGIPGFPMYHPALGIHEPKKMLYIRTDWHRFRSYLSGTLLQPVDEYPEPDYREVESESEIHQLDPSEPLACDTESIRGGDPFCLTFSQSAGTGSLIRASSRHLLDAFQAHLTDRTAPTLFHNWLYDWPVTEALGLQFPHRTIVDTMARVFHLGNLPQGLKALAFRELGMTMQDFDDLVTPYSKDRVLNYYETAQTITWEKPEPEMVIDEKTGLWKLYSPQSMNTKLKRFFTDYRKNPEKDVFNMWEDNWVNEQQMIEDEIGLWPGKCITHVPFEETLFYACRDADALIRLWPVIRRMSKVVRRYSQELWREKAS